MKKLLGIVVLGLLFSGNAFAKIIDINKCYNPEEVASHDATKFKDWSFSINLNTGIVMGKMEFHEEYAKEKELISSFNHESFKITNYDNNYIYAYWTEVVEGDEAKKEISINLKTGEVLNDYDGFGMLSNWTLKCQVKDSNGGSTISGSSSGTAFFVSKKGHLLTNNHVVEGCSLSKITYRNKEYETTLIAKDKTLDLALLKAKLKPKSFINFSKDGAKKLTKIYVAGYPLGKGLSDDLKISSGIVSSLKGFEDNSNEIQIDAPINPGNSGGPIINENGDLIAIAVSGLAKDQTEGINFGIKSSAAELFLKSNKVSPSKSLYSRTKNNDVLLEILEEGTVYTYCD